MKWSLQQLYNLNKVTFDYSPEISFDIKELPNVLNLTDLRVIGRGKHIYDQRFEFDFTVTGKFLLEDSVTLESIEYLFDETYVELFDTDDSGSDVVNVIEKNTLDLDIIVWENIRLSLPMRVTK